MSVDPADAGSGVVRLWVRYLLGRVGGLLGIIVALTVFTFLLVQFVPGDPARNIVGLSASPTAVEKVRRQLGLNQPVITRFWHYVWGLLHGNLGSSFVTKEPITQMLQQRLPVTAEVAFGGLLVVILLGFPMGLAAATLERQRKHFLPNLHRVVSGILGAVPEYISGTILILVFALQLRWLPVEGTGFQRLILPSLAIGLAPAAFVSRIVRNEARTVLGQEYIATARSKRISTTRLLLGHVLPNVATSVLTTAGIVLVALLGATVIVENVFGIPGLGTEIVSSIISSDYPAIQGVLLTLGILAAVVNLAIDVCLGLLDPRVLHSRRLT